MGKALADTFAAAREVFQEVDDALSQKLSRLMWEGPGERSCPHRERAARDHGGELWRSSASLSAKPVLALAKHARLVAGHSLGEYTALCAAGAFTLADTARLLKARGQAMQTAVPVGEGGMSALARRRNRAGRRTRERMRRRDRRRLRRRQRQCAGTGRDLRHESRDRQARPKSPRPRASSAPWR